MAEWRPDGWDNPYEPRLHLGHEEYEAGADAMLAALRKGGVIRSESLRNMPAPGWKTLADGDWVFIPDVPGGKE